jgi:hypothetical protein
MALWKFSNLNKYGNIRTRIIYRPDGESFGINPKGFGPFIGINRFKYEYKESLLPPHLCVIKDQKYIMPTWTPVLMETQLSDIDWIKPKKKKSSKKPPIVETNKSSSSSKIYTTTFYPDSEKYYCDCPGTWRTGGNCKHIKKMRNEQL